ncbi:hypothetical protein F4777DRAFT_374528 [Nemania sp. FL0916]|nr:hypothetical protein F4777DRAFT_374528 [Nemania sp. FL0916]
MKLTSLAVALAGTGVLASSPSPSSLPTPPLPPWYPLQAWSISNLSTYNPHTSPYGVNASGLYLTITSPQYLPAVPAPHASGGGYVAFNPSTATCELHWKADDETPYGYSTNSCVPINVGEGGTSGAQWTITLNELHTDLSAPGDYYFSLSFALVYNATYYATRGYKLMTGGKSFEAGDNIEGQCTDDDNGGLCEYRLTEASSPALLQPTLQECKSACG